MTTVRRLKGTHLKAKNCKITAKHGGGSVMICASFSGQGIGPITQVIGIMDRFKYKGILEDVMIPYAEWNMPLQWVFQHDNDPKHTSNLVKEWLVAQKIQVMKWPAQSPDLSPIENLFGILKRKISGNKYKNQASLMEGLKEAWMNIPPEFIENLIASMPKRCAEVIKNKGSYIKY